MIICDQSAKGLFDPFNFASKLEASVHDNKNSFGWFGETRRDQDIGNFTTFDDVVTTMRMNTQNTQSS